MPLLAPPLLAPLLPGLPSTVPSAPPSTAPCAPLELPQPEATMLAPRRAESAIPTPQRIWLLVVFMQRPPG
jgi:hypothetical protein